jgi:non-lysosomal glucosylceramidase
MNSNNNSGDTQEGGADSGGRDLRKLSKPGSAALRTPGQPATAGPFDMSEFEKLVPSDKKLNPAWVRGLTERGTPDVYKGGDLKYIGMPVGGICAGQLYLGGDGRLWHWDVFNRHVRTYDEHYAKPVPATFDIAQGFALALTRQGETTVHMLDHDHCPDVSFRGEYPIGTVDYGTVPGTSLTVSMEAFSPFVPLSVDDSSLPATMMRFTVSNPSAEPLEATLYGWLENMVCGHDCLFAGRRVNRVIRGDGFTFIDGRAVESPEPAAEPLPDICFEDWSMETYEGWTVEGLAFGTGPIRKADMPPNQGDVGGDTERVVNSNATAPGTTSSERDKATGKLTSRKFVIERNYLNFWIGGGNYNGATCLNVVVDGKVVRTAIGRCENRMRPHSLRLKELIGKEAHIELVDAEVEGWGHIGIGRITFSDTPVGEARFDTLDDNGTMGLALMGDPADFAAASHGGAGPDAGTSDEASVALGERLTGALGRKLTLPAGGSAVVDFAVTWHFPNLKAPGKGRHYATRFASAREVAEQVARNHGRLYQLTRLWRDTWYDSTLPYWFLDRAFLNASILASSTSFRFENGGFWGWEGVGCCEGTCTHVWHYEQTMGRIFPELDIILREHTDFNPAAAFAGDGSIGFRGQTGPYAIDGQAGIILRCLRDHQVSPDGAFLKRNWGNIKKAIGWMIDQDTGRDGIINKCQHNTLDEEWYGEVAWLSGLYLAALRAGEEMALEMGDRDFAAQCAAIVESGRRELVGRLFNGEYFIHTGDPQHPGTVGSYDGCEIDQVLGQSWAWQVNLGQVLPREETLTALQSLWKYNFTPDVGPYREAYKDGRWYAMAGEAGTLMCTWPRGDSKRVTTGYDYYFNECMNGFEYQLAGHMVWENMLTEGLAVMRAVHDRYHPSRRNPWNEVECGDHYARSMAAYGVFIAACGFECHGPKGHIGFAPRVGPENFKSPFTAAEGWGTYQQQRTPSGMSCSILVKHGSLRIRTISLAPPAGIAATRAEICHQDSITTCVPAAAEGRVLVTLPADVELHAGESLELRLV